MPETPKNPSSLSDALNMAIASGKLGAVGIAWYNEADYPAVLRVMKDGPSLPRTHHEWQQRIAQQEQELIAKGVTVLRAIIDPQTFPGWCAARGHQIDAKARMAFASEHAARQVGLK